MLSNEQYAIIAEREAQGRQARFDAKIPDYFDVKSKSSDEQ